MTNTSFVDGKNSDITFPYDSSQNTPCLLEIMLEVSNDKDHDWVLCSTDDVDDIEISIKEGKWSQKSKKAVKGGYVWTFEPNGSDVVLAPQDTMLINLSGIKTSKPTGATNLYLSYTNVSGYKDGKFICQIEKSPLVYPVYHVDHVNTNHVDTIKNIGIGTTSSSKNLDSDGTITFGTSNGQKLNLWEEEHGIGIQSYTTYFRTSKDFAWYKGGSHNDDELDPGGGTVQMVIKDGNVGIGTPSPSETLEVHGTTQTTDLNVTGNSIFSNLQVNRNVGIGTAPSSNAPLEVNGAIQANALCISNVAAYGISELGVATFDYLNMGFKIDTPDLHVHSRVAIGTATDIEKLPSGLSFGSNNGQKINLWEKEHGIGIQSCTTYFRTSKDFAWYKGGSHNDNELDPGGGTVQMVIKDNHVGIGTASPSAKLDVNGSFNIASGNTVTGIPVVRFKQGYFHDLYYGETIQLTIDFESPIIEAHAMLTEFHMTYDGTDYYIEEMHASVWCDDIDGNQVIVKGYGSGRDASGNKMSAKLIGYVVIATLSESVPPIQ